MSFIDDSIKRLREEEKERRKREQAAQLIRGPQSSSNSNSTNSSTSSQNSSQTSQGGSQSPSAVDKLFHSTARKYTNATANDNVTKNNRNVRSAYTNSSAREKANSKKSENEPSRVSDIGKWLGNEFMAGIASGNEAVGKSIIGNAENINKTTKVPFLDRLAGNLLPNGSWNVMKLAGELGSSKLAHDVDDYFSKENEKRQQNVAELRGDSGLREKVGNLTQVMSEQLPMLAYSLLSGGSGGAASGVSAYGKQVATSLVNPASLSTYGNYITRAVAQAGQNMSENPYFWDTFLKTFGPAYYKEKDEGANDAQALVSAAINSFAQSAIEIGGGFETAELKEGFLNKLKEVIKSSGEEGSEEIWQDIVDNLTHKALGSNKSYDEYNNLVTTPWFSTVRGKDAVINPANMIEQGAYGAVAGGLMTGTSFAGRETMNAIANSNYRNANPDLEERANELIQRASLQGREGEMATRAQNLAEEVSDQMARGKAPTAYQMRELESAVATDEYYNQKAYESSSQERYNQAVEEGKADTVKQTGTADEYYGFRRGLNETEQRNYDKAKAVMGENASENSVVAVSKLMTGSESNRDIDTILLDPEARSAVEELAEVTLPINNVKARAELENIALVNQIANRDKILEQTHKDIRTNMSKRGGELFDDNYDEAVKTLDVPNAAEIYENFFSRFYTAGTVEGADFEKTYNRIISPLVEDFGEDLGTRISQVFTHDFAQKVFAQGQIAMNSVRAKAQGQKLAIKASENPAGFTYEEEARKHISDREANLFTKLAERMRVHIRLVSSIAGGQANGSYDPETGVILIAADSDNKFITVFKHELTHHLKNTSPELYQKLEDFVFKKWYDGDPEKMEERVQEYQRRYNMRPDQAREEIIADASEAFFTDEGAINEAVTFNEKMARAIHDGIKSLLDTFLDLVDTDRRADKGYGDFLEDLDILRDAEKMWLEALNESVGRSKAQAGTESKSKGEVKHSLKESDQAYMDAVNRGDMKTAQRMVDEQAKRNGYNIKVFHGTPNETISASRGRVRGDDYKKLATDYADKLFPYVVFRNNGRLTGIYTSTDRGIADAFSYSFSRQGTVYDLYARADKPFTFDAEGNGWNNIPINAVEDLGISKAGRITLEDVSRSAKEQGYDAVVVNNVRETGSGDNESPLTTDVIVFNSNQLKSADPVTYDDKGNVIPLSERFNEGNDDIRYSLKDSDGNTLSKGQQEYFKDSKLRDENGNLYVMYHGTQNEFNVFDFSQGGKNGTAEGYGIYLSNSREVTDSYGDRQIKSYVNMKRPASALESQTLTKSELRKLINAAVELDANKMLDDYDGDIESAKKDSWISNYVNTYQMPMSKAVDKVIDTITDLNGNDMDIVQEIMNGMGIRDFEDAAEFYDILTETTGIDGFVTKWGDESEMADSKTPVIAVAFRSNQIKNVDNTNPTNDPDIRYSIKEKNEIENLGGAVTKGGTVAKYSLKSWNETDKKKLLQNLTEAGFTDKEAKKWIKQVNSVAAIIYGDMARLDYEADEYQDALKPNSEYFYTLDLSTLCAKRRLYQGTYNAIMKRMPDRAMMPEDTIRLRRMMADMRHEVPCGICYEESRKKNEGKFADVWLNGQSDKDWNQKLKEYNKKLENYRKKLDQYNALENKGKKKPPKAPERPERWLGYANMEHEDPYIPTLADVTTTTGRKALRENHPEALEAYLEYQKGRGSANPKVSFTHTDYRGDIMRMTATDIENVKHIGGLRIQSFSDFETVHVIDMMQAVMDMASRKLTSQAYTKVPAFADIFGGTGIKINLSLIGMVKNGKLVFDSVEGIDPKEAFRLRKKYSKNVGTIIVGANAESILAAWKDPRIDMVIPFHRSGWSTEEFEQLGLGDYKDFQEYQTERYLDGSSPNGISLADAKMQEIYSEDYWDYNKTGKENAEAYLELCAKKHYRPVFYNFLHDNGDGTWSLQKDGSTDGYWKSLVDYKMYDNDGNGAPQTEVRPIFDMRAAKKVMDKFDGDPNTLPIAQDVVDRFVKEYKDTKYSLKSNGESRNYQNTITKLENQVKDLKSEFKRTNLKTADQKQVRIQAGKLITRHGSNMQAQKSLIDTFNEIFRLYKEKGTDAFDEVYEIAKNEAVNIVNNISVVHNEGEETYKAIKDYLRNTPITISEDMKRNITDFNDFRKRYFGKLKITNGNTTNIDTVYMELMELFPEQFTEDYVNPADQLYHMADVLDNYAPYYETLDGASEEMQDYVVDIASDIMETAYGLQTKKTFADKKYEEKVRAVEKARQKALESRDVALDRQKKRYEKKLNDLKQHNKDVREGRRERKEESELRSKLLKVARRLDKMKTTKENRTLIQNLIGDMDLVAKSMTGKTLNDLNDLRNWYDEQKEADPFFYDSNVEAKLKRLTKKQIANMDLNDVRDLNEVLRAIETSIRNADKFLKSYYNKSVKKAGLEVIEDVNNSKGVKDNPLGTIDRFFINGTLSPERQIHRITGYNDNDPLYVATKELSKGQRDMLFYQMNSWNMFKKFMKDKQFINSLNGKKAREIELSAISKGKETTIKVTPDVAISLYLSSMNDDNMRHMGVGGVEMPDIKAYKNGELKKAYRNSTRVTFSKEQLAAIEGSLTKQEKAFADTAHEYYNSVAPKAINEVSEILKGYSLAQVENYFPIQVNKNFLDRDFESLKFDGTIEGMGSLKERVKASNPIVINGIVDTITRSINENSMYVGLAIPVRNYSKLLGVKNITYTESDRGGKTETKVEYNGSVNESISKKWGDQAMKYIEKFMTDLQTSRGSDDDWEAVLNKWRSNYAGAVLTLNASVAIKQAASYPTAMAVLGAKPLARAMADVGKVDLDLIEKYTPLQWYRSQGYSTKELGDIRAGRKGSAVDKLTSVPILNWIQAMDVLTTRKLWKASEYYVRQNNRSLKQGSDEYYKAVADIYNRVIEETQPNYTVMQRPGLLRSDKSMVQMLNMFKTQPYQNFNILYDSIGNYKAKAKVYKKDKSSKTQADVKKAYKDMQNAVLSQVLQLAVFAAMTSLWALFRGKDDKWRDEDGKLSIESYMKQLGKDMLSGSAAMIPLGADLYNAISSAITGDYYYGFSSVTDSSISDLFNSLNQTMTLIPSVAEYAKERRPGEPIPDDLKKSSKKLLENTSRFSGIPYSNLRNLWDGVYRWVAIAGHGEYVGEYLSQKATFAKTSVMMDNLYKAYRNDKAQYDELRQMMIDDGIKESSIDYAMKDRMKKNKTEAEQKEYDDSISTLEKSALWRDADAEDKEDYEKIIEKIAVGIEDGDTESYAKLASSGVSEEQAILYKLALKKVDKPNKNGNLGTYTNDEKEAALRLLMKDFNLTSKQKEALKG